MPRLHKPSEPVIYEGGFTPGNIVVIESPDNVKGSRTAVVLDKQKWCKDGGIPVMLADENEPVRYLCIRAYYGDTIRSLRKNET